MGVIYPVMPYCLLHKVDPRRFRRDFRVFDEPMRTVARTMTLQGIDAASRYDGEHP
jgi:hypothetical protein